MEIIASATTKDGSLIRIVKNTPTAYAVQISHVHPYLITWDRTTTEAAARKSANTAWARFR